MDDVLELAGIIFFVQLGIWSTLFVALVIVSIFRFGTTRYQKKVVNDFTTQIKDGKFELHATDKEAINKQIKENDEITNDLIRNSEVSDEDKAKRAEEFYKALNQVQNRSDN